METNDVLAHACLGHPSVLDILYVTRQGLHPAEMHGKTPLSQHQFSAFSPQLLLFVGDYF